MKALMGMLLLALLVVPSSQQGCSSSQWECNDGGCIPATWECDSIIDCVDGSDEDSHCDGGCTAAQWECGNGECIPAIWECDSIVDCADGTDEDSHCTSGCSSTQWECNSGQCIPATWECDGITDCADGSDEDSHCNPVECSSTQWECNNGECIPATWECDGITDCGDGSDEDEHCDDGCTSSQWECLDGTCIPAIWECDDITDCPDGSDEDAHCLGCQPSDFVCDSGLCVNGTQQCDGMIDCDDFSDESTCPTDSNICPFVQLGLTSGVEQITLPRLDNGASNYIDIPTGFPFGDSTQNFMRVDTNGYLSFGDSPEYCCPFLRDNSTFLVFPFWDDTLTDNPYDQGEVSYEVHTPDTSVDLFNQIRDFIQGEDGTEFCGTWMLVSEWSQVPSRDMIEMLLYDNSTNMTTQMPPDVTLLTNTFQAAVVTNGYQSYTVFKYACGLLEWSSPYTAIGYSAGGYEVLDPLSGSVDATSTACQNNDSIWSNLLYKLSGSQELPYIDLGAAASYVYEDFSEPIYIDGGFPFGIYTLNYITVAREGLFFLAPEISDGNSIFVIDPLPFNSSTTNSTSGQVSYATFLGTEEVDRVSRYISRQVQRNFSGYWMLVADWRNIEENYQATNNVNSFQSLVITDGVTSYTVFIYKCGDLQWGNDVGTTVGYYANGTFYDDFDSTYIDCRNSPQSQWTNMIINLDVGFLPFLEFGTVPDVFPTQAGPTGDDSAVGPINIPGLGFRFGPVFQTTAYLASNGFITFGVQQTFPVNTLFPTDSTTYNYMVAPYWDDFDPSDGGVINYEVHDAAVFTSPLMSRVNTYVIKRENLTDFRGSWMMIAEWRNIPPFANIGSEVNTVQAALITNGTASYTFFIYQCGKVQWVRSTATIGFNADGTLFENHPLSGTADERDIACAEFPDSIWTNVFYPLTAPPALSISISASPTGPDFSAATWIDLTCNAVGISSPDAVLYRWTVSCYDTGSVVEIIEGASDTYRIRSTPLVCSDVIECSVEDSIFQLTGSDEYRVTSVIGAGLFSNDAGPILNNSVVQAGSTGLIGSLYCMSASRDSNIGQWYSPDGSPITSTTANGTLSVVYSGGGSFPSYTTLEQVDGMSIDATEEGVYTCEIPDQNGTLQVLFVGIYGNSFLEAPTATLSTDSHPYFTVYCAFSGSPTEPALFQDLFRGNVYTDDESHFLEHVLLDAQSATYQNSLAFGYTPNNETGVHTCQAVSLYNTVSSTTVNTQTSLFGIGYYGLYEPGEHLQIGCGALALGDTIQWLGPDDSVIVSTNESTVLVLNINPVTDSLHGDIYTCRITDSAGVVTNFPVFLLTVVPRVPIFSVLVPSISDPPFAGTSGYQLFCVAFDVVNGLDNPAEITWLNQDGSILMSGDGIVVNETEIDVSVSSRILIFDDVRTSHAGVYSCQSTFESPGLTVPYMTTTNYSLIIASPDPLVILEIPEPPHIVGSTLTLTCRFTLPDSVDEGFELLTEWTNPAGNRTVSDIEVDSDGTYYSILDVELVDTTTTTGTYTCNVSVIATSPYVIGSSATDSGLVAVNDPSLVVQMMPRVISVLDVAPYNSVSLTCTVTAETAGLKTFEWFKGPTGTETQLIHNGTSVVIDNQNVDSAVSTSVITTSESEEADVVYTCRVLAFGVVSFGLASVTVRGPSPLVPPIRIRTFNTTYESTTIEWVVPYVGYTPETYIVSYGTDELSLSESISVDGVDDFLVTNQSYLGFLTNLLHNRTYYYQITSVNVIGSITSDLYSFVTVPLPLSVYIEVTVGTTNAGDTLTLTCYAFEEEDIPDPPMIQWLGITNMNGVTISDTETSGVTTTSVLEFSPLAVYHEGLYTCQAYVGSIDQRMEDIHYVSVQIRELTVIVTSSPVGPYYQAASSVTLQCEIFDTDIFQPPSYMWESSCDGDCFVPGSTDAVITRSVLRSADNGIHTCTATDAVGNRGSGNLQMNITGIGISIEDLGYRPDNDLLVLGTGLAPVISCASESLSPNVGSWIGPDGSDLTNSLSDPFTVTFGGSESPGFVRIEQVDPIGRGFSGIYSCELPDLNDDSLFINIGLYTSAQPPSVVMLQRVSGSDIFTLNCISTTSPPTTVEWRRSGLMIPDGDQMRSELTDRIGSVYNNYFEVSGPPSSVIGEYECAVSNALGSDTRTVEFNGIQVTSSGATFAVGTAAFISCSTDLDVATIEWWLGDQLVVSGTNNQLNVDFNPVTDDLHGRVYTCRVTSPYGVQEESYPVTALILADEVTAAIVVDGDPFAGQTVSLTCMIAIPSGITNPVEIEWRDINGPLMSDGRITVTDPVVTETSESVTVIFDPLRTDDGGNFVCEAVITSTAPPFVINQFAELDLVVQIQDPVVVTIVATPESDTYGAGSSLSLSCRVSGGFPPFSYLWSSTCTGDCFVSDQNTTDVSQSILHSSDSGDHTCYVEDNVGHAGEDTITLTVSGVGMWVEGYGLIDNNSIIQSSPTGALGEIQCISGSADINVGRWIAPQRQTITTNPNDVFVVDFGGENDPGFLSIQIEDGQTFDATYTGIYTCAIPDETGEEQNFHVGIYLDEFTILPTITSLQLERDTEYSFFLNCTSEGSPPAIVVWQKDGVVIEDTDMFSTLQFLRDGTQAIYDNVLVSDLGPDELSGVYSCIVQDSLERISEEVSINVEGLIITGNENALVVGETAAITCSSDFEVTSIQWLYDGNIVTSSSEPSLDLEFSPVSDQFHQRTYTCRVTTPFGTEDQTTTVLVEVTQSDSSVFITTDQPSVNNYPFTLTCVLALTEGVTGEKAMSWTGPDGSQITTNGRVTVAGPTTSGQLTNLTLTIDPLQTSDEGLYTCTASVASPAVASPLMIGGTASWTIVVQDTYPLPVAIIDTIDPTRGSGYVPGSEVNLTCTVTGDVQPVSPASYQWTSTCMGCFVLDQPMQATAYINIIHAVDAGDHTCTVSDADGNTGSETLPLRLIGASMYTFDTAAPGVIPPNSAILTDSSGNFANLQCISGTLEAGVGQWISPDGEDLTDSDTDPFDVTASGTSDPGYLQISAARSLASQNLGLYTCSIPDYMGDVVNVYVGIYHPDFIDQYLISILSLEETSDPYFTLNCNTLGSPPTDITWSKDGVTLINPTTSQVVTDTSTAMYSNLITIVDEPDSLVGTYQCTVQNSISGPEQMSATFEGLQIIGDTSPNVGDSVTLTCATDLPVTNLELIFSFSAVMDTTDQRLDMVFDPIEDLIDGREYTCRATSINGVQERTITFDVTIPPTALMVTIAETGIQASGETYQLDCTGVVTVEGINGDPLLEWIDPNGVLLHRSVGDITPGPFEVSGNIATFPLVFNVLKPEYDGVYTCRGTLHSLSTGAVISTEATSTISVETVDLEVTVVSSPTGTLFPAASALALTCNALLGSGDYSYSWSSDCIGDCFVLGAMTSFVSRAVLHSRDAGTHTCAVTDSHGNIGSSSISVTVIGVAITYSTSGLLPNNSIIFPDGDGRIGLIECISGSLIGGAGQWIGPDGSDLTDVSGDPFEVTAGGDDDPGTLQVTSTFVTAPFMEADNGVYSCFLPDEAGESVHISVGIYQSGFNVAPSVTTLERQPSSLFTLKCTSTGSPATSVTWTRNGAVISGGVYRTDQVLTDGIMATYENYLVVSASPEDIPGTYGCFVSNDIGISNTETINIEGVQIDGNEAPLIVGNSATITCSSDLDVLSIEWLSNGVTLDTSTEGVLTFDPVTDNLHNQQYTCRVTSPYGSQSITTTILVVVPPSPLDVSTAVDGSGIAGEQYYVTCTVVVRNAGLVANEPQIIWSNPSGDDIAEMLISTTINGSETTSTVEFNPLRTSLAGLYTCTASLESPAVEAPFVATAARAIFVTVSMPSVILIRDERVYAGSEFTITCSVEVDPAVDSSITATSTWMRVPELPSQDSRITISSLTQQSALSYASELTIIPISATNDTGVYTCNVILDSTDVYIRSVSVSASSNVPIQNPTLMVDVSPAATRIINASSYNAFTLTCSAEQPSSVVLTKAIEWRDVTNGGNAVIDDGSDYDITYSNLDSAISSSILSGIETTVGARQFSCVARIEPPSDSAIVQNAIATVTTDGPVLPSQPVDLAHISVVADAATVQWFVPSIVYSPETYTVYYDTSSNALNSVSVQVMGIDDIMAVNQIYSVILTGLSAETTYYYEVRATNLAGITTSDIASFTTATPELTAELTTEGSLLAGTAYTVTCSATVQDGTSGAPDMEWRRVDGTTVTNTDSITIGGPFTVGQVTNLTLLFDPLRTTHGNQYSCVSTLNTAAGTRTALLTEQVVVQIPSPRVNITGLPETTVYSGTSLSLTCSLTLDSAVDIDVEVSGNWLKSSVVITSDDRITVEDVMSVDSAMYRSQLTISPLSNVIDSARYTCDISVAPAITSPFITMSNGADSVLLQVEGIPAPDVVIENEGLQVAGEENTLTCSAAVISGLVDTASIDVQWTDLQDNPIIATGTSVGPVIQNGASYSRTLLFNPLKTSHAIEYVCRATISVPEISASQDGLNSYRYNVQIPIPSVMLTLPQVTSYLAGSSLSMVCLVDISPSVDTSISVSSMWRRGGTLLLSGGRYTIDDPTLTPVPNEYRGQLQFSTLSSVDDSGSYSCEMIVDPAVTDPLVISASSSDTTSITVEDPVVTVSVSPTSVTGLNVAPYNDFTISCSASKPEVVIPSLDISWMFNGQPIDGSQAGIMISNGGSDIAVTSELSVMGAAVSSTGDYTCVGSVDIEESATIMESSLAMVVIRGPDAPVTPVALSVTTNSTAAVISWLVVSIAYTPETYSVGYGTSTDSLGSMSNIVQGTMDIEATSTIYSVVISGLSVSTQYYYQIRAENTEESTQSDVDSFFTSSLAPTAPPQSLEIVAIAARTVSLSWLPPPLPERNGNIVSYTATCTDQSNDVVVGTEMTAALSVTVENLTPNTPHTCTVTASNNAGEGPPTAVTFTTREDAPEDSPINVVVTTTSSSTLLVTWSPPLRPHGEITVYTVYVSFTDGSPSETFVARAPENNATVHSLQPYQEVVIEVSASTDGGEGPRSDPVQGRTFEEDIAPPVVALSGQGDTLAGQQYTLLCTVTVETSNINGPVITWLDPERNVISSGGDIAIITSQPQNQLQTTSSLQISSIRTSYAGVYTCSAAITSLFETMQQTGSDTFAITAIIPPPSVTVTALPSPLYAGTMLTITCTTQLIESVNTAVGVTAVWKRGGSTLTTDDDLTVVPVMMSDPFTYQTQIQFDQLPYIRSDGVYSCEVIASDSTGSEYITDSIPTMDVVTLMSEEPPLQVDVQPETVTALDSAPANTFVLTCTGSVPDTVNAMKSFSWERDQMTIADNGDTVLIVDESLDQADSSSVLTINMAAAGDYEFRCSVDVVVPGRTFDMSDISRVTVKARQAPVSPALAVTEVTSDTVSVDWTVANLAYNQEAYTLRYGSSADSVTNIATTLSSPADLAATDQLYTFTITSLDPSTTYYFQVESMNSIDTTTSNIVMATTLIRSPTTAPINFLIEAIGSTEMLFSWDPPTSNEVIDGYRIACDPSTSQFPVTFAASGSQQISGFTPATMYTCSVLAFNAGGNGPEATASATTTDGLPGTVNGLRVNVINTLSAQVLWNPPTVTNGRIRVYSAELYVKGNDLIQTQVVLPTETLEAVFTNLAAFVPYTIRVSASTGAGSGDPAVDIFFTREGVPTVSPSDVDVIRLSDTRMNVTWTRLSLEELQGFSTGYTISYERIGQRKRQTNSAISDPDASYLVIDGLLQSETYSVTVSATTAAGLGPASEAVTASTYTSSLFQLRLSGLTDCSTWVSSNTQLKIDSIVMAVVSALDQSCGCPIQSRYFTDTELSCPNEVTDVIFRARLFSVSPASSDDLVSYIQSWVETSPIITYQTDRLAVYSSCEAAISSFSDDICELVEVEPKRSNAGTIAGIVVGVIVGLLVLAVVVILAIFIFRRWQRKNLYKIGPFANFDEPRAASRDINLSGNFATPGDITSSAEALKAAEANIDTLPVTTAKPNEYEELPTKPPQYEDLSGIQNPLFTMDGTSQGVGDDESTFI